MEYQYYKINYQNKFNASSLQKSNVSMLENNNHKHNYTAWADQNQQILLVYKQVLKYQTWHNFYYI
jgi:hypothetical protein